MTQNSIQQKINEDIDKMIDVSLYKTQETSVMIKNTVGVNCKNCGSDNVNMFTKQTRSADEAASRFYTCLNCGNKWRVG